MPSSVFDCYVDMFPSSRVSEFPDMFNIDVKCGAGRLLVSGCNFDSYGLCFIQLWNADPLMPPLAGDIMFSGTSAADDCRTVRPRIHPCSDTVTPS